MATNNKGYRLLRLENVKGIIFDYGGTLDTRGDHWGKVLWKAYVRQDVPVTEEQFREAYVHGERTLARNPIIQPDYTFHKTLSVKLRIEMEYLCTAGMWNANEKEFAEKHSAVLEDLYATVKETTAYSKKILEELKNTYPMVLVSNFYGNINEVLREFELSDLFDDVIESAVVGIRKPDARIFSLGVEALGLDSKNVVVIGDSFYKDIEPAVKAGCRGIWFKGEGWTEESYDETVPSQIITDLEQLFA